MRRFSNLLDIGMLIAVIAIVALSGYVKGLADGHSDMQRQILAIQLKQERTQMEAYSAQLQMIPMITQTMQAVAQMATTKLVDDPTGKFLDDIGMKIVKPCRSDGNNGGICDQPWQLVPKDKP
jgi:hypothetical protein